MSVTIFTCDDLPFSSHKEGNLVSTSHELYDFQTFCSEYGLFFCFVWIYKRGTVIALYKADICSPYINLANNGHMWQLRP